MNATEGFLRYVLSTLLRHPEQIHLEKEETDTELRFSLRVAKEDIGRLIGRHGRTISAIRGLMQVSAGRSNKHALLVLEQEEKKTPSQTEDPHTGDSTATVSTPPSHAG